MKPPVHLQTKYGYDLYCKVASQFYDAKVWNELPNFKQILLKEREKTERELLNFLNDPDIIKKHKMDDSDPDGWQFYKETADKYSILNYFFQR